MNIILVAGGSGFAGYNFIRYFLRRNKNFIIVNLDKNGYNTNPSTLSDLADSPRYHIIKGDVCNHELVNYIMHKYRPQHIINFASDVSTRKKPANPLTLAETNILGTVSLLEGASSLWSRRAYKGNRFIQVSTDEVYGTPENNTDYCSEESRIHPLTPFAATKAGAELIIGSYFKSYGLPSIITRGCLLYGPYQNSDGFIPSCIINNLQGKPIPVYGEGSELREWMHVMDHSAGISRALFIGRPGETYNLGSREERTYAEIAVRINELMNKPKNTFTKLQGYYDLTRRRLLNSYKSRNSLDWSCKYNLDEGLKETIEWYTKNTGFWNKM